MMKRIYNLLSLLLVSTAFEACDNRNDYHEPELNGNGALFVSLDPENRTDATNIFGAAFNEEGVLADYISCNNYYELANTGITLTPGVYNVAAIINNEPEYQLDAEKGVTKSEFFKAVLLANAVPNELFQTGISSVNIRRDQITHTEVKLTKVAADLTLSVSGILDQIANVSFEVSNAADGFHPATDLSSNVHYSKITESKAPVNGEVNFGKRYYLPTAEKSENTLINLYIELTDGSKEKYSAKRSEERRVGKEC